MSSAAQAYRDAISNATRGLVDSAEKNAQRVAELRREVDGLHRELRAASDRHVLTRLMAEVAWDDALELLWVESWITMRPFPRPDPMVKPAQATDSAIAALNLAVEEASAALREAVQGRRLRRPGS